MLRLAALLVFPLALAGCAAAGDELPAGAVEAYPPVTVVPAPPGTPDLEGRTFLIDEAIVDGEPRALVDDRPIGLRFLPDRKLGIDGGCGVGGTQYQLDGDQLQPGAMTVSAVGCEPAAWHEQDQWLLQVFAGPLRVAVVGQGIELRTGKTVLRGREQAPDLDGRAFLLDEVTVAGEPRALVNGKPLSLEFAEGRLGMSAGCNGMGGPYYIADGRLHGGGARTDMYCEGLMEQEDWFHAFIDSGPEIRVDGDTIELRAGQTVIRGRHRPLVTTADLDGRTFELHSAVEDRLPHPFVDGEPILLAFDHGRLSARGTCNGYSWGYGVADGRIVRTSEEAAQTTIGCAADDERQDAWVQSLLLSGPAVVLDGETIELRSGETVVRGTRTHPNN